MKGIKFLIDENGRPKSVIVDLEVHSNLWEDIYDELIEEGNPLIGRNVIPWKEMKAEIKANAQRERAKYR